MSDLYFLYDSILEKCGFFCEKRPFFRADMAGLGKYWTGGYGRIGVYRVAASIIFRIFNESYFRKGGTNIIMVNGLGSWGGGGQNHDNL